MTWDGEAYNTLSDPQFRWGTALLDTVLLRGDETILDAGCGSGRITAELLKRLPHGRVIAFDSSASMLDAARSQLKLSGNRVEYVLGNLSNFELATPVDGVFSNAVFHWVSDHDSMFRSIFHALQSDGWILAQFGGEGNIQRVRTRVREIGRKDPFTHHLKKWPEDPHYESVEATVKRLKKSGFIAIEARLHAEPVVFTDPSLFSQFVEKIILHRVLAKLPEDLQRQFLSELTERASHDDPPYMLDYVRLTIRARHP
jgi:trans-aconitate 2-methyltransferase